MIGARAVNRGPNILVQSNLANPPKLKYYIESKYSLSVSHSFHVPSLETVAILEKQIRKLLSHFLLNNEIQSYQENYACISYIKPILE